MKSAEEWLESEFCERTSPTTGNFTLYGIEAIQRDAENANIFPESTPSDAPEQVQAMAEILAERQEIAAAFVAKYNLAPDDTRQLVFEKAGALVWQLCRSPVAALVVAALELQRLISMKASEDGGPLVVLAFRERPEEGVPEQLSAAVRAFHVACSAVVKAPK